MNPKKRNTSVNPFFLIFGVAMLIMACVTFWWNTLAAIIELICAAGVIATVVFSIHKAKSFARLVMEDALNSVSKSGRETIENLPVPAAIIEENGRICIVNGKFVESIAHTNNPVGDDITDYLFRHDAKLLDVGNGADALCNGKWYLAFAIRGEHSSVVYFLDDNEYKTNSDEYKVSRPVVAIIAFDNREEIERESKEGNASQILIEVENTIRRWATSTTGFYKKLSGGRFLVIMEERHMKKYIDEKFRILEEVRSIRLNDRVGATLSIGIGRGGEDMRECEAWARQALEMALGRGGDQAAVKNGETYEFFGGVSKGVEKRDKVRTRIIATTLATHIRSSSNVLIMGHRFSDLDSVGSAIGMWSAVSKSLHKEARIVINKSQSLAKALVASMEAVNSDIFIDEADAAEMIDEKTILVIVDTHSPNFLEYKSIYNSCKRIVVIDHHRMMVNHIDNALVFYHEPYASSASEMVAELIQYLGENTLTQLESEALLSGIMLDTKNFVLRTGVRTFEAAAFLKSNGADTVEVKRLFSNSIQTYKNKCKLVSEAEIFNCFAIACAEDNAPDIRVASAQAADELLGIENVKASFVLYRTQNIINISARSLGDVNVQVIMEAMGGGGHLTMAACQIEGSTMEAVRERLVSVLNRKDTVQQEQNE